MLFYHPAFDGYHAAFRMLQMLSASKKQQYERETLRILDFYLVFPQLIADVRLPKALQGQKRAFSGLINKYHFSGSPRTVFMQMAPLHDMALRLLVSKRLVELDKLLNGVVLRSDIPLPKQLDAAIRNKAGGRTELLTFIVNEVGSIPLHGEDGLKARTSLMDYRYDTT